MSGSEPLENVKEIAGGTEHKGSQWRLSLLSMINYGKGLDSGNRCFVLGLRGGFGQHEPCVYKSFSICSWRSGQHRAVGLLGTTSSDKCWGKQTSHLPNPGQQIDFDWCPGAPAGCRAAPPAAK